MSLEQEIRDLIDRVHTLYWRVAGAKGSDLSKGEGHALGCLIFELDRLGDVCEEAIGAQFPGDNPT